MEWIKGELYSATIDETVFLVPIMDGTIIHKVGHHPWGINLARTEESFRQILDTWAKTNTIRLANEEEREAYHKLMGIFIERQAYSIF